jgi:class 3 adenylate cyclase/alpha-beta hydrolase superfamily lysophospholipase
MVNEISRSDVRYAQAGRYAIAYQTIGDGPADLVFVDQWFSNVDAMWEFWPLADLLAKLGRFSRVIVFDKRGTGLSDPIALDDLPTVEEWIDDLRAVLDDAGSTRSALLTGVGASLLALVFAATYPERASALVLVDPFARAQWAPDNPWGYRIERLAADLDRVRANWGTRSGTMALLGPDLLADRDLAQRLLRYERESASPGMARAMIGWIYDVDVRHVLPTIRVPTLVLHHRDAKRIPIEHGRDVAAHVPGARLVELSGSANYTWAGDTAAMLAEVQAFVTGASPVLEPDRLLATVLFTDIVDSTRLAHELGDMRWRELLAAHDRLVQGTIEHYRGRVVKSTGDGVLATFDGPARAVLAAASIRVGLTPLGLRMRAGLHTGEIQVTGADIAGIAVHIAARISALARPEEILTSSTVRDLVAGSGIVFEARGTHRLKGITDQWRVFAAEVAIHKS